MNRSSLAITFLLTTQVWSQEANEITFELVTEEGFNEMAVSLSVPFSEASNAVSILSGTLVGILNINEATNQTDTLTFIDADLEGSDIDLVGTTLFGPYDLSSDGMEAGVSTITPPGVVTPATGEFEADQHSFTLRNGTLSGTAAGEDVLFNFLTDPFVGAGTGTGTVVITPTSKSVDKQFFNVSFTNPISIDSTVDTGVLGIMADVTMDAILKAASTTFIERAAYAAWADSNLDSEESPEDLSLHPGMPNGLIYALGFDANNAPQNIFSPQSDGFQLQLAATGTREEIVVEWSTDLINWERVPDEMMTEGSSAIPIGSSSLTVAGPDEEEARYYRVRMVFD